MSSFKRILWSANDPGGANAILPVVAALRVRGDLCKGLVTGPARDIASRAGIEYIDATDFDDVRLRKEIELFAPDVLLAGRSIGYTVDKRILGFLKEEGIPSVYVLDFWNEYWQRFSETEKDYRYLPSVVCVMDELAKAEMVDEGVPPERIAVTGNPYFEHFADAVTHDHEDAHEILFISQPLLEDAGNQYGFDEYTVLEYLTKAFETLPQAYRLGIRLHPRDNASKYDEYLGDRISLSAEKTLEEALSKAGLVVGMFSPVLMQAAAAGKRVLSVQPGGIGRDLLPTNRTGLTRKIVDEQALCEALAEYASGAYPRPATNIASLWPQGAAERIVQIIDRVIHES